MKMLFDKVQRPAATRTVSGFSLVELLMAITVLILIVLVMALVFQQANTAWGSGTRKAGAETTLRSIMGIMERDLTSAVDATQFGPNFGNDFVEISSSANTIEFVNLDGTNRMPQLVQYTLQSNGTAWDLLRATQAMTGGSSPTNWVASGTWNPSACLNGSQPLSQFKFHLSNLTNGLPWHVEIEARVLKQGAFAVVSGWSAGRNRPGHPEDTIVSSP